MRNSRLVLFALICSGCAGGAATAPPAESPAPAERQREGSESEPGTGEEPDRFVLLRSDASLYRAPGAEKAAIDRSRDEKLGAAPHLTRVFRLIGERGEWLEVENLPWSSIVLADDSYHCQTLSERSVSNARLRFYVERSEVFPVLEERVEIRYDDGTSLALEPGTPLGSAGRKERPDLRWVRTAGLEILIDIDDSKVGWYYSGEEPPDSSGPTNGAWLKGAAFEDRAVTYGGGAVVGPVRRGRLPAVSKRVYRLEDRGDRKLVELRGRCIRLEALVPARYVSDGSAGVLGALSGEEIPQVPRARAGASVYWRGGDRAGEVVRDMAFHDEVGADGRRRCFRVVTRSRRVEGEDGKRRIEPVSFLELCFDPEAILDGSAS